VQRRQEEGSDRNRQGGGGGRQGQQGEGRHRGDREAAGRLDRGQVATRPFERGAFDPAPRSRFQAFATSAPPRRPMPALVRASAIVITSTQPIRLYQRNEMAVNLKHPITTASATSA